VFYSPANNGILQPGAHFESGDLERAIDALLSLRTDRGIAPFEAVDLPGDSFEDSFEEATGIGFVRAASGYEVSALDAPRVITHSVMKGHHQSGEHRDALRGVLFTDEPAADPNKIVPNTAVRAIVERFLG
jgi:hypothetical protein